MNEPLNPEREQEIREVVKHSRGWAGAPSTWTRMLHDVLAELDHTRAERDEAFRCRDAALRALNRDDVELDTDLEETIAAPFYGPGWDWDEADLKPVVREVADVVRPALGKLTEERDRARRIAVTLEQENARLEDELAEEKALHNRRLPRLLIKAAPDKDTYIGWSTVAEMPDGIWSRETALEAGMPRTWLARADETGTSATYGEGAWDDSGFIAEQRGWLRRDRLGDYAKLWLADREDEAFDLLEPFEGESEVRR